MQNRLNSYVPVCELDKNSRPDSSKVCFFNEEFITWADFKKDVSKVRKFLESKENTSWILHVEDAYYFAVSLLALLQSGRRTLLCANKQRAFIHEIWNKEYGFLTDSSFENATLVQDILKNTSIEENEMRFSKFDKYTSKVVLYTSGSTGKPKVIEKCFVQLENEVKELVKTFGNSYLDSQFYTSVNHHHIYGLLYSILIPISTGLPFCRHRLEIPTELFALKNFKIMLVLSPAFLKRLAIDITTPLSFKNVPVIHSSGGVLPKETALKVMELTGSFPKEIYGCTESGGIGYRQSKSDVRWTPFDVCRLSLAKNGCLNVCSSYILESEGFLTSDLATIFEDGKFELKGRNDSIVKIEEKRISLFEVEERLRQSGFVQDVCVIPMEGKRQYLAACIVFSAQGKKEFEGKTKLEINNRFQIILSVFLDNTVIPKKWRYLEELPENSEGKIKMRDVKALFLVAESLNFKILR